MSKLINVRTGAAAIALAGATLVPVATADAQTITTNAACHVYSHKADPSMTIAGSGFGAGDSVDISDSQSLISTSTTANAAGQIAVTIPVPPPSISKPQVVSDTITADDDTTGASGTTTTLFTTFDFGNNGTKRAPGLRALEERTTWTFTGFPVGRTIWGHYLYHGKQVARQSFGRASGPCGTLTSHRRAFPATPRHKAYVLQADGSKRYSAKTKPSGRIPVALTFF